jgi:putative endonuclease
MALHPPLDRRQAGAAAEDAAQAFLIENGLQPLARNVRYPFGEIDLVMLDSATLVFVEVRFRRNSNFGGAAVSVDAGKRRKIARASQAWLSSHKRFSTASCRFDVVAATPSATGVQCEWIRSAFTMDDLW